MIRLYIFAYFSIILNILFIWYSRKLAREYVGFVEKLYSLEADLVKFNSHLKGIYELETFYGDTTLEGLLRHSKELVDNVTEFYDSYTLENPNSQEVTEDGDS